MKKSIPILLLLTVALLGCGDKETAQTGTLNLNFRLQYDGMPLVMFDRYQYPNGMEFFFTKFSFYLSNLSIKQADNTTIDLKDIDFLNLTNDHETAINAASGTSYTLEKVPVGAYQNLIFNIGVPTDMNSQKPSTYPSDHPLSDTGEYWDSWKSYIFSKTEGKLDTDGDGQAELGLAYHIGSDETLRQLDFQKNFNIQSDQTTTVVITIEMKRMFDDGTTIFDPLQTAQIHSLTQLSEANTLADNLKQSFVVE